MGNEQSLHQPSEPSRQRATQEIQSADDFADTRAGNVTDLHNVLHSLGDLFASGTPMPIPIKADGADDVHMKVEERNDVSTNLDMPGGRGEAEDERENFAPNVSSENALEENSVDMQTVEALPPKRPKIEPTDESIHAESNALPELKSREDDISLCETNTIDVPVSEPEVVSENSSVLPPDDEQVGNGDSLEALSRILDVPASCPHFSSPPVLREVKPEVKPEPLDTDDVEAPTQPVPSNEVTVQSSQHQPVTMTQALNQLMNVDNNEPSVSAADNVVPVGGSGNSSPNEEVSFDHPDIMDTSESAVEPQTQSLLPTQAIAPQPSKGDSNNNVTTNTSNADDTYALDTPVRSTSRARRIRHRNYIPAEIVDDHTSIVIGFSEAIDPPHIEKTLIERNGDNFVYKVSGSRTLGYSCLGLDLRRRMGHRNNYEFTETDRADLTTIMAHELLRHIPRGFIPFERTRETFIEAFLDGMQGVNRPKEYFVRMLRDRIVHLTKGEFVKDGDVGSYEFCSERKHSLKRRHT